MSNLNSGPQPATHHEAQDDAEEDLDLDAALADFEAEVDGKQQHQPQRLQDNGPSSKPGGGLTSTASAKTENIYNTLKSDDATLQFTTEYEKAVVHFFHPDFARCSIMDTHLETIARKHAEFGRGSEESEVHFGRVDVSHAPFVVERMGIRVLPCVIGFVNGAVKGRIVGFEGLCWDGKEKSTRVCQAVEEAMVDWNLFKKAFVGKGYGDDDEESDESDTGKQQRSNGKHGRRGIQGRKQEVEDDDDWY